MSLFNKKKVQQVEEVKEEVKEEVEEVKTKPEPVVEEPVIMNPYMMFEIFDNLVEDAFRICNRNKKYDKYMQAALDYLVNYIDERESANNYLLSKKLVNTMDQNIQDEITDVRSYGNYEITFTVKKKPKVERKKLNE